MKPYSMDLRQRRLEDGDTAPTTAAVAAKYRVSTAWGRRLKQRKRPTGTIAPKRGRAGPRPRGEDYAGQRRQAIRQAPDATLAQRRDGLGLAVALSTLWRAVTALGWSVKKSDAGRRARPARRGRQAGPVAGGPAVFRPRTVGLQRRDVGRYE